MFFIQFLKKPIIIKPLYLLYIFNLIVLFGIVFGFLPREVILGSAFLIFFYLFLMKLEDGILFFLSSIPFFVALPVSRNFDSLNIWRIAILILFFRFLSIQFPLKLLFNPDFFKNLFQKVWNRFKENKLELWTVLYFLLAALSIFVATDKIIALKRLFYIFQMALVYPLTLYLMRNRAFLKKAIKYLFASSFFVFLIGICQLIFAYFASLGHFWGWWTWRVAHTFYGDNLANIVARANTWFSYYPGRSPTLRIFSTFTDSHSFALYLVFASPLLLWLIIRRFLKTKKIGAVLVLQSVIFILMQFSIALSGTRGIWISIGAPLIVAIYFVFRNKKDNLSKFVLGSLLIFILMLLLSSFFLSIPQFNVKDKADGALTIRRLKSIIDLEETSNQGRLFIWRESLKSITKHPFLGVGIANFPVILEQDILLQKAGSTAHNVYLNSAVEMGILGMILIVMIFYEILKKCWICFKKQNKNSFNILGALLGFYFLWAFAYCLFDIALFDARVMMFFAAEVALITTIPSLNKREIIM
jgi:O-antigen ligase